MTSYPWPSEKENPFSFTGSGGSVSTRVKAMICNTYAYQRLPASELVNKALATLQQFPVPRKFPWAIPAKVDVIYNMVFGPQKCKDVEGFPNVKRDGLSCPLAPGSGQDSGDGSGDSSSVSYVTDTPTYLPTTGTDFSTATGKESTPDGVFVTASFTLTDIQTTTLPTTTVPATTSTEWETAWVTASTTVGGTTTIYTEPSTTSTEPTSSASPTPSESFTIFTMTVGSSCCPYPDDSCGVESMSLAAPIYCSAITARGFEYLNDVLTTTSSNTGPRSTAKPY